MRQRKIAHDPEKWIPVFGKGHAPAKNGRKIMAEAPGMHDPNFLPPDIPVPQDDGRARHLTGAKLPDIALPATDGRMVNLSKLKGRTVLYVYPRTGVPGVDAPPGWDQI